MTLADQFLMRQLAPSMRVSFDPIDIDWDEAMAGYDDRRAAVALAVKFARLSSVEAKEGAAGIDPIEFAIFTEMLIEGAEAFVATSELLTAVRCRLDAVRGELDRRTSGA